MPGSEAVLEPQRQRLDRQVEAGAGDFRAGLKPVVAQAEPEVGGEVVPGADPDVGVDRVVAFIADAADPRELDVQLAGDDAGTAAQVEAEAVVRAEEHTPELQTLMRISYAVFC